MTNDPCNCIVEVSPEEVDAGTGIALKVRVECPPRHDLRRPSVSIRNQENAELARVVYRAVVIADKGGALHEQASSEVRFSVKPHAAQMNVWNAPSATVAGERFRVSIGVRCSAGCNLGGQELSIFDQQGFRAGTVKLADEVWPGTEALYFAEAEASAPLTTGSHRWEVRIAAWVSKLPHATGSFPMVVRVVGAPDCEVTVRAVDRVKQTPIKGAHVVLHPYRAVTDENGIAKVKVTRGPYDILVSGSKYVPVCTSVEVTADMVTRTELDADRPWESPDEVPE